MSPQPRERVERNSRGLYARAMLFVLLGSGALIGAVATLSAIINNDATSQLLDERMALARTAGGFVEARLRRDLERLATGSPTALFEDRLLLDRHGEPLEGSKPAVFGHVDLPKLAREAKRRQDGVVSPLVRPRGEPVVVAVVPIPEVLAGDAAFAAGTLRPVKHALFAAAPAAGADVSMGLVDTRGRFVASTDLEELFELKDHEHVLAKALEKEREFRGQCHSCHEEGGEEPARETNVLAFAPLPTLDLGLTVLQPERSALALAYDLRTHLWQLGGSLILLFVTFTALAVRSVVRPIKALTAAVRHVEASRGPFEAHRFGADEVGELAGAFERWHARMDASLSMVEEHREALRIEGEVIRRHLDALQGISDASAAEPGLEALLDKALGEMAELCGIEAGALRLQHSVPAATGPVCVRRVLEADVAVAWLDAAAPASFEPIRMGDAGGFGGAVALPGGLRVTAVLAGSSPEPPMASLWLGSLARHVGLCASHVLLRDAERARTLQQQRYLHAVLRAQEEERRRVARELHDTVAQDLAALRLDAERLSAHAALDSQRTELIGLEARAGEMLDTVRRILLDLRPTLLETMGFVAAVRWLVERVERQSGLCARLILDGPEAPELRDEASVALFRITQEALSNAAQHAAAEHVFVTFAMDDDAVILTIEDDGVGFEAPTIGRPGASGRGLGLRGMLERARLLGGEADIASAPDEGTTLTVRVPRATCEARASEMRRLA